MTVSRIALAGALAIAAVFASAPAAAQLQPHQLTVTNEEHGALTALQAAAAGTDRAAQDAALAAARTVAQSAAARYALGNYQFQIGRTRGDAQMMTQAIDAMVASGVPQGAELAPLLASQASRLYSANDLRGVDRMLARIVELQPNNAAVVADYAQYKARLGENPQAVTLFQRALELQSAAGQAAPESWHKRALALAYDGRMAPQGIAFAHGLVAAYPSAANWRDALLAYRTLGAPDPALSLDITRLLRAAHALTGERDYMAFAEALNGADAPGEAKAVLDEGIAAGMLSATEDATRALVREVTPGATRARSGLARARTQALAGSDGAAALAAADTHFGLGEYVPAAELYRAALQKGGQDPNLVNSRLGAALALAGQRAEAEAALRAVTGPRANLAAFWLTWLSRPAT